MRCAYLTCAPVTSTLDVMALTISYELKALGWADCTISDQGMSCTVSASYLSDALCNLVIAATAIVSDFAAVTFRFDEEPGEYRWVIKSPRPNEIELKILEFPQTWGGLPDEEGVELFRTICLPGTFGRAVLEAAEGVLSTNGIDGYAEKWSEHPFPTLQLEELGRLLKEGGE